MTETQSGQQNDSQTAAASAGAADAASQAAAAAASNTTAAASSQAAAAAGDQAAAQQQSSNPWDTIEDPELKAFANGKGYVDAIKELKGAQALIGKKAVGIPGEGSTPEEQAAFHKARGVPESEAAYKFDDVLSELTKDLPEGLVVMDADREKETRALFKAANISNGEGRELVKRILGKEIETRKTEIAAAKALEVKTGDLLNQAWGGKREEYTQDANNYLRAIGMDDDVLTVMNSALGTKPEQRIKFMEMARKQGALLREGGQPTGMPSTADVGSMTPLQAKTAKEQFLAQGDNRSIYLGNRSHPRYQEIEARVTAYAKVERGIK